MNTAENVVSIADIAFNKSDMVFAVKLIYKSYSTEFAVFRRKLRICNTLNKFIMTFSVVFYRLYGSEFHSPFLSFFLKLSGTHHCTVVTHYFAAKTALFKSGKAHKIDGSLSMTVTFKYAVFLCRKRKHMPRSAEILGSGIRGYDGSCRKTTFLGGNTCSCINVIYRNRKSCAVIIRILIYHLRQVKLTANFFAHRHTDKSLGIYSHKIYIFRCSELCGADHIALVPSAFIVSNENYFAVSKSFKSFFN